MGAQTSTTKRTSEPREHESVQFRCLLDEQPDVLLPRPARLECEQLQGAGDLIFSPYCQFFCNELVRLPFLQRFHSVRQTVWILDPASDALVPFGVGETFARYFEGMRPGEPPAAVLSAEAASVLHYAGLLVPEDYRACRQNEWAIYIAERAAFFREHGYISLERLFHPFHLASLRHYYRALMRSGEFKCEKEDARCLWLHNEVTTRFFHHQLTSTIRQIVGEAVKPSYCYVRCYRSGADLPRHTDREQCEFTVSLCVDYTPEPGSITGWPIYVEAQNGTVTIEQAIGDALLFRGRELPHYRRPLPHGCTSTSVFFHFVARDFQGDLD